MSSAPIEHPVSSILFVCLGNICRSPLAEGIFLDQMANRGLDDEFVVDSAGTGAWHAGERPDPRSIAVAARHGVTLPGRARQVTPDDLRRFDLVVAMDRDNLQALKEMADGDGTGARLCLLREYDPDRDVSDGAGDDVPDPYYGGANGFDTVYQMIDRSCERLLTELRPETRGV